MHPLLSRSRQLYRKIIQQHQQPDESKDDIIQAKNDLKALQDHPGWKRLEKFMKTQKEGAYQYMEQEVRSVNLISLIKLVNTFAKFLFVLFENRAYNKIKTYIAITIQKGKQYEAERERKQRMDKT